MTVLFSNNASTTLSANANDSATSITVTDGSVFPTPSDGDYFYVTLESYSDTIVKEICKCTERNGDTLTVVRAQDGTTANAFSDGDKAELRLTAGGLNDFFSVFLRADSLQLADNEKANFGAGDDLQIVHNGSHSYILDRGEGNLILQSTGTGVHIIDENTSKPMGKFSTGGSSSLWWAGGTNDGRKIETTETGVSITGALTASDNITAFSDKRLKEEIRPIDNALDKVQQISGKTYSRNDLIDTNRRYAGVIAQEIEAVLPEAVTETLRGTKTVDYNGTVALLIESIKELKAEVDELKSKMEVRGIS